MSQQSLKKTFAYTLWASLMTPLLGVATLDEAHALSYEERQELDLSEYEVTDADASYFNIDDRLEELKDTQNSLLLGHMDQLQLGESCRNLLSIPPLDEEIRIPGFYPSPEAWRLASEPMFQFEDKMSGLAGSYIASGGDDYYGECIIKFLDRWAQADALVDFYYAGDDRQAWYATESMIFSAAMAYSIVRPRIGGMEEEKSRVDDWLNLLAHNHSSIVGGLDGSCCNNHFYRRSIYASMIGILTEDNELFRYGVSSIYSALSELTEDGAFPLEMERGRRATHYQNYALLYLVTNMQIISRQGYDVFNKEINGRTISDAIDFFMAILDDPTELKDYAPHEQYRGFLEDGQYFTWMEIYLSHVDDPRIEKFLQTYRPVDNRGAGGYISLYFMDPEAQQRIVLQDSVREKADVIVPDAE